MFEETYGTTSIRTSTENAAYWQITALTIASAWLAGGAASWAAGYLIAIGILGPLIFYLHWSKGHFRSRKNMRRYALFLLPPACMLITYFAGLRIQPIYSLDTTSGTLLLLRGTTGALPVNTSPSSGWAPTLLAITLYLSALNIFFILESRWVLSRILHTLLISGACLTVLGYLQMFLAAEKILGIFTPPGLSFFATFPHSDLWSAYALLLTGLGLALTHQDKYLQRWRHFLRAKDAYPLYLTLLIGSTLLFQETPGVQPALLALIGLFFVFETTAHLRRRVRRRRIAPIIGNLLVAALFFAGAALFAAAQIESTPADSEPASPHASSAPNQARALQSSLIRDSWHAFKQRPVFGWGEGSFPHVFAFYQEVDLQDGLYTHPRSDLMRALVERGVVGTAIWALPLILAAVYTLRRYPLRGLSWFLLTIALIGTALGLISYPFASPAYTVLWWSIFFSALRWSSVQAPTLTAVATPTARRRTKKAARTPAPPRVPAPPPAPL